MAKTAIVGASRGNFFRMEPDDKRLRIPGWDTPMGPNDDPDVQREPDPVLAEDLLKRGMLENVHVRANGKYFDVIYGRDRVKAARLAKQIAKKRKCDWPLVKVEVDKIDDTKSFDNMVVENCYRREISPIIKAKYIARKVQLGGTIKEAAQLVRMPVPAAKELLTLLDLDDKVQDAIKAGKISVSAALPLVSLERSAQVETMEAMLRSGKKGAVDAEIAVARAERSEAKAKGEADPARARKTPLYKIPGKSTFRQMASAAAEGKIKLSPEVANMARYYAGDLAPNSVPGLVEALRFVGFDSGEDLAEDAAE